LAISLAQCCHEGVILVDADVRAPDMHDIYEVPLSPGLAEVMLGESSLRDAIHPTAVKNVHLLPAGFAKSHPHLLLHHDRLQALLTELQKKYRYVVLDTPPVLAVGESLSVCKMADGVLICALRDVSRQPQVQLLQQRLRNAGAKALGVVLGGVSTRSYASKYGDYAYQPGPSAAG
jgi:capsular exopolysaccharide synthesis family protein